MTATSNSNELTDILDDYDVAEASLGENNVFCISIFNRIVCCA